MATSCIRCGQPFERTADGSVHPHCAQVAGPGIDPDLAAANREWWAAYYAARRDNA